MAARLETAKPIRVAIADDDPLVARALHLLLDRWVDIQVVAEVSDGEALIESVNRLQPDVVLVDLEMPVVDGLEAIRRIRAKHPLVRCLVLTVHQEESYLHQAAFAGASGYLSKGISPDDLAWAVRSAALCGTLGRGSRAPARGPKASPEDVSEIEDWDHEPLSPRELQVIGQLAKGRSTAAVASALGVSPGTVRTHTARVRTKMGLPPGADVVMAALRRGLVNESLPSNSG